LIVLTALTTGMRIAEIFALRWSDLLFREELIAVRAKLKRGGVRYAPMCPELAV
jgi:integrase